MDYLDAASTEPLHPAARAALLAALDEGWADPSRLYRDGRQARLLLDGAREVVAGVLGARPDEVSFTASGTQAAHLAVLGTMRGRRRVGNHLVLSAVEHSCIIHSSESHQASGGIVTIVGVDRTGRVRTDEFVGSLRPDTALACLQTANHEVGTAQPVAEVAEGCATAGVPLLVDAAQSVGRLPVPAGWSVLTASAHKWGGPPGVGVLAVRKGTRFRSVLPTDEREGRRVPGFENVPAIVAAAAALRARSEGAAAETARLSALVDLIRRRVSQAVPDVEVVGDPVRRLPHIVTFSCLYVDGEALLLELDRAGFAVSSGSSCTSSTLTPSHVLEAMGVLSHGNVRVSLPHGTTADTVERFLAILPGIVARLRALTGTTSLGSGPGPGTRPCESETPEAAPNDVMISLVVDALGRRCPIPVIELARRITDVPLGGVVAVLADDEAARLDIPAWCQMRDQEYLGEEPADRGCRYLVRRIR